MLARFCGRQLKIENASDNDNPELRVTEIPHEIDMRAVFRRLGGNVSLYRELFDQSQKSIPHQWQAFTGAVERDDRKQARAAYEAARARVEAVLPRIRRPSSVMHMFTSCVGPSGVSIVTWTELAQKSAAPLPSRSM